jgi:hypothetical protein
MAQFNHARPYNLTPLPVFGMEVYGIDLKAPLSEEVVELIKEDVTKLVLKFCRYGCTVIATSCISLIPFPP